MALNDIAIKNAEIRKKKYRIGGTDTLLLKVYANGSKGWRVRYWRGGKETMLSLGSHPAFPPRKQGRSVPVLLAHPLQS